MRRKPKSRVKTRTPPRSRASSLAKTKRSRQATPRGVQASGIIPGEVILAHGDIVAFEGRPSLELVVTNLGDRPIQVGSHCHFFEVNRALRFDRERAFGYRLCIPAGTAVRFEPGEEKRVTLIAIGGKRVVHGINALTEGRLDDAAVKQAALTRAAERGFRGKDS